MATKKGMGRADRHARHVRRRRQVLLCTKLGERHSLQDQRTSRQNAIVANLAGGKRDYAQAAIDTAAAIGDAAGGGSGTVPSGGAGARVLVGAGVVAAGGAGTYLYLRNRRKKAARPPAPATGRRAPNWTRWPG